MRGLTLLGVSFGNLARGAGEQLELALDDRAADRDPGRRRPAADPARRDERGPRRAELDSALDAVRGPLRPGLGRARHPAGSRPRPVEPRAAEHE